MDSQQDSLDIAKLKRFALGFDETDVSQALVSEAESQISSSLNLQPPLTADRRINVEERVSLRQSPSRAKIVESVVAVHIVPSTNHDVHELTERVLNSQEELLSSVPESNTPKMSAGDSGTGDTQPISQSIYENIISRGKSFQPSQARELGSSDAHSAGQESFQMTVREGETGHIDLLADFEPNKQAAAAQHYSSDDEVDSSKDGQSSPSQFPSLNVFPESQRFLTTPITAEKSRDVPNMAATTPSLPRNPLAADFSSSGGILPLSQLFKATQTPVSPFAARLTSGPLSDRPSPDLPIQARPLNGYTSSPSRTPRANFTRTHTDPFSYVSMDESQKRRNQRREERRTRSAENIDSEEPFDKDFEEESSLVQRSNRRRNIDHETSLRLASITHGRFSSDSGVKSSTSLTKAASREVSVEADETQEPSGPLNGEDVSEVETDREDVAVVPHSQTRHAPSSSEEDKENHVGLYTDTAHATAAAHDRLSQVLDMHNDSTMIETPPAESHEPAGETCVRNLQQVINVRDSQPSSSQGALKHKRTTSLLSQSESVHIRSSYDDSSPPTKRQRRQRIAEQKPPLSPSKQSPQQNARPTASVQSPTRPAQHQASSNDQGSSTRNGTEKPSSIPSLVANTPVNKAGCDTIPETSIPGSSPHRSQPPVSTLGPLNQLPVMQETEEDDDDDLPPQRHLRQRNSGLLATRISNTEKPKFFLGSSPDKGSIKTLSELSADMSPQSAHGDTIDVNDFFDNDDDEGFSRILEGRNRTPRKRLQKITDYLSPHYGSSPLKNVESTRTLYVEQSVPPDQYLQEPESPSVTPMRAVARRQHARPSRLGEDMYEMEGSPRVRKRTSAPSVSESFEHLPPQESASEPHPLQENESPTCNSQQLAKGTASNDVQPFQTAPEKSAASSTKLSVSVSQAENLTSVIQSPEPEEPIIAPNQVLAFWNGRKRAYYPATFMHAGGPQRCVVAFADSGPVDIALGSVKKLQLRVGDAIKIDFPTVPKVTHIIRGFSQQLKPEELTQRNESGYLPVTDIYGYSTVIVSPKQRKSIPGGGQLENEQTIEVPIYSIYLDMILWNQMKGRSFTISEKAEPVPSILQTPSRGVSTPISPASRLSRTHLTIRLGLFSGMVFAISLGDQDAHKNRIVKLISANGGQILQDGFEELFEYPSSPPAVTQAEALSQSEVAEEAIDFRVASKYENTGFACLIADKHSRRAKYMQALALNLPCLSRRWIEDCVEQNRILSWDHYLLPAGESSFLYGAIKSRVLTPVAADKALFSQTFDGRAKLLDGQSVLLVLGRGKTEERHKAYIFLMYALGAARVARVLDLKAAKVLLRKHAQKQGEQPRWDWLYVDDTDEAAAEVLVGGDPYEVSFGSKKRKRSALFLESNETLPQVMSNDLVCQSLILGKICK
ncbi:DNA damage repair protein (Rad9), putative [Talaromyces stipitatus ATCC 10500]|uniref:DNA damage repair protein (Rad9), putative n=1 Tax=Talaromyces stipitatus (strain ATCC 10500 / CBS 375.48 / QM 6759 / NRRL 1006) TaxID=441959 RepID=B8M9R1_TALSN|nr:DNA damage repair protein (Rad9), putative [Talaromyces stipitatus ATCC 10500]EED18063.1 DNA damage repair protein (Rad9), putative [Talaromyces stipitatus ATCC 10500]